MNASPIDLQMMTRAIELAARGQGKVEPNPLVGCVITLGGQVVGEGWHREFGGPHAEINAIQNAQRDLRGATIYVSLEPCCHHGKTPPCADAIIQAGMTRVVVAQEDPFRQVAGRGLQQLRQAGLQVDLGIGAAEARKLNAPYLKRVRWGRPWIMAKWAMTLDGKLATRSRHSQWISSTAAREIVHRLRGRVDAVMVGSGTAAADDPQLTARPAGLRSAARIVVDSLATLSLDSKLVRTSAETPVFVAVGDQVDSCRRQALQDAGCQIMDCAGQDHLHRLDSLLSQLAARSVTNVLVEGGGRLLGNLFQLRQIDEVHAFIATKLAGGQQAITPIEGLGIETMDQALSLESPQIQIVGPDVYVSGHVQKRQGWTTD